MWNSYKFSLMLHEISLKYKKLDKTINSKLKTDILRFNIRSLNIVEYNWFHLKN